MPSNREQLNVLLQKSATTYWRGFTETEADSLLKYYDSVLKWNNRLHLTTLIKPQAFYERHIQESAFSSSLILSGANQVWDLGSGLGVPGMIIAILRRDLNVHLVEAGRNKAFFLEETAQALGLKNAHIVEARLESFDKFPGDACLTVRAIEGMERMLPVILRSGAESLQTLIFGAKRLEVIAKTFLQSHQTIESLLIPGSSRRYIINIFRST